MNKKFFKKYSWFLVGYNVLVILWGAVVRATGSGAGCGGHWPLCNGQAIPAPGPIEQVIEYSHRISSALDGLLVILLVVLAFRLYPKPSKLRWLSLIALFFILTEGALGRALVVNDWVAGNVSAARAVAVAVHLTNTYLLLGALTITAWFAWVDEKVEARGDKLANRLMVVGLVLVTIFSAMGAVTALGDTLFPAQSLLEDMAKDFDSTSNFLIQLRVIHPVVAILSCGYLFHVLSLLRHRELGLRPTKLTTWLSILIGVQILAGAITILSLAPLFMQITHLLLADTLWIGLVVLTLETFTRPVDQEQNAT